MENSDNAIIKGLSLKGDMSDSGFKFFDRIEGMIYPGTLKSSRRESTKTKLTEIITFGYDSSYINPLRNFGEFVQSSGNLRLETFKASNAVDGGCIDIGFEFMSRDNHDYTVNEMIIWWGYSNGNSVIQFKSAPLKIVGGIKNSTRIFLNQFGIKYHYETLDELYNTLERDLVSLPDNEGLFMAVELYIR